MVTLKSIDVTYSHSSSYCTDFKPPSDNDRQKVMIVAGTVAATLFLVLLFLCIMWRKGCLGAKVSEDKGIMRPTSNIHYNLIEGKKAS